jgi:SH3-like domain-containing protein
VKPVWLPKRSLGALLLIAGLLSACGRVRNRVLEVAYVSAPQVALRDRLAAVYNKTGTVKNGDRVDVLERERRFLRIRGPGGAEGWVEQRYIVSQQVFDQVQQLAKDHKNDPVQAMGTTRNDTNIHVDSQRDADHLYLLAQGDKVSILKRAVAEKEPTVPLPAALQGKKGAPKPVLEDWWLIRDSQGRTGWVLSRLVDLDVPLEIAQYAEGQRIQAYFVLHQVQDEDKKVAEYLVMMNEPHDGLPYDYDQARVFTWNLRKHRYETAYRERKLEGYFPVTVGQEDFGKEGVLPVFTLKVNGENGNLIERKYKLNTPIVRRVLGPGEAQEKPARPSEKKEKKKKHRR